MKDILIRKTTPDDILILQKISRETFAETFASSNSEHDMALYLKEGFSYEKLISN